MIKERSTPWIMRYVPFRGNCPVFIAVTPPINLRLERAQGLHTLVTASLAVKAWVN